MGRKLLSIGSLALLLLAGGVRADSQNVLVDLNTSMGNIRIQLDPVKSPATVDNFLTYVRKGAYDGTIFHRVIVGFVVQGGGHLPDMSEVAESEEAGLYNEAANGLRNVRGSIAMARGEGIDSATRQFYFNTENNPSLDHSPDSCTREDEARAMAAAERGLNRPLTCATYGYAVFGHVIAGMEVLDEIELIDTEVVQDHYDVPVNPVLIKSVRIVKHPG